MKTFQYLVLVALCFSLNLGLQAQENLEKMIYSGFVMNSPSIQKEAIEKAKAQHESEQDNIELRYQLLEAQYILLNGTFSTQDEDTFDEYADDAVDNAKEIIELAPKHAKAHALLSSLYGLKIAYSPMKGMFLGAKSGKLMEKAINLDEAEPVAWFKFGASKFNTPETWGGDKKVVLESFEKAVQLFETKPNTLKQNFQYLDALAWLGIAYKNAGQTQNAIDTYTKALELEPNFMWVKSSLLPKAESALK